MKVVVGSGYQAALMVCIVSFCVFGMFGCQKEAEKKATPESASKLTRVEVVKIEALDFTSSETLTGETEANEVVTVSAESPGRVLAVNMKEGGEVARNQWLIRVDAQMDATRLAQYRTTLEQSRRDRDRTRELLGKGLATPADMERAEMGLKNARTNIQMTRVGLSRSVVSSPIAGVVDKMMIERGEYAGPGTRVAMIVNYDTIIVRAGLPESLLPFASEGQSVNIKLTALDIETSGVIRRVGIQPDKNSRTFPLEIEVENSTRRIRPGLRADVNLPTVQRPDAVMVPRTALLESVKGSAIFVLGGEDKVERREVVVGGGKANHVFLTSGLKKGETLVVVGQQFLADGQQVKVLKSGVCCKKAFAGVEVTEEERAVLPAKGNDKGGEP